MQDVSSETRVWHLLLHTIGPHWCQTLLNFGTKEAVSESDLKQALMDRLQEFMLEDGGVKYRAWEKKFQIKKIKTGYLSIKYRNVDIIEVKEK